MSVAFGFMMLSADSGGAGGCDVAATRPGVSADELCDGAAWGAVGGGAEPGQLAATPVPYWTNLRFSHPNENTRFTMMDNDGRRVIADHGNNGHTVQAATVDGVFRGAFAIAFECSYSWGWAGIKPVQIF